MKPDRTMRLASLGMVNRIADERASLLRRLDVLKAWPQLQAFVITIEGERQDESLLALVRPVIEAELKARLASLDRDLEALGVTVARHADAAAR